MRPSSSYSIIYNDTLPASAAPGVDDGALVTVWTPTTPGFYSLVAYAPDYSSLLRKDFLVDEDLLIQGIYTAFTAVGVIVDGTLAGDAVYKIGADDSGDVLPVIVKVWRIA